MVIQKELFRTSILCKYYRYLVFIEVEVTPGKQGKCPQCGCKKFRESTLDKGWTECCNDDCDFQVLTAHLKQIEDEWGHVP